MEILPFLASASGSPTICHTAFLSVSSSIRVTVAPKVIVSPESFDTSMNFGARELVLELGDAAFVQRLRFLRRVIFGVLGQVAVGARVGDLLNDARPLHLLAVLELGLKRRVALRRHRNLVHRLNLQYLQRQKFNRGPKHRPAYDHEPGSTRAVAAAAPMLDQSPAPK